ncbi:MAG: VanZ family protein [Gemmatimonadota bacterium]|nr:VanZ family protein [Gemmatimonadota bacterium]
MTNPTALFTSRRERRLWLWALAVVVAIYSTLGLAGSLAEELRERDLLPAAVLVLMLATVAAIIGSGLKRRPGHREVWVALGVTAVYAMAVVRMGGTLEERTHLFEYGIVAVLIYQALRERVRNGRRVPAPAVLALVAAVALGWLDEGLQALIPNRVYDNFDVVRNSVAAAIGIAGTVAVGWVNEHLDRRRIGR